jgi:hypothetical protein
MIYRKCKVYDVLVEYNVVVSGISSLEELLTLPFDG